MQVQPKHSYTLEEYLELDKNSEEKFEFWDGGVWNMSGASLDHNRIVMNLSVEIAIQARKKKCEVFGSDLRVKIPDYPPYRYPDLTALCGVPEIEKMGGLDLLVNPQLIVEVLSESTEAFDRGDKFSYYKSIESFTEYILIAQHRPHVTQFVRQENGWWLQAEFNDLNETVEFRSIPCRVALNEIYRDVHFGKTTLSESETERSRE